MNPLARPVKSNHGLHGAIDVPARNSQYRQIPKPARLQPHENRAFVNITKSTGGVAIPDGLRFLLADATWGRCWFGGIQLLLQPNQAIRNNEVAGNCSVRSDARNSRYQQIPGSESAPPPLCAAAQIFVDIRKSGHLGCFKASKYPISEIMPRPTQAKRPRGRPRSGKEGFCIRMSPITHETLKRAAESEGMRLGDWLDDLAGANSVSASPVQAGKRLSLATARARFIEVAPRATATIRLLHDVFDLQPSIGQHGEVQEAIWHLDGAYAKLRSFLSGSGAMPWESIRQSVQPKVSTKAPTHPRSA